MDAFKIRKQQITQAETLAAPLLLTVAPKLVESTPERREYDARPLAPLDEPLHSQSRWRKPPHPLLLLLEAPLLAAEGVCEASQEWLVHARQHDATAQHRRPPVGP